MPTIQAIEGGKLKLTSKLAARIAEATGASEAELLKGAQGKARTVDGQKYTAASFHAWEAARQRRGKPPGQVKDLLDWAERLLKSAEDQGEVAFGKVRTQWIESLDKVRVQFHLEDAVNTSLLPFQSVESYSAEVGQWKKSLLPRVQKLGYHSALPIGTKSRLTLSWQVLPSWSPGTPPPLPIPTNTDLIPAGYCVVGLGTAGCRMADVWWQSLCAEHGIDSSNGVALYGSPTGNWRGFFRKVSQVSAPDKYMPRAIFADLDEESLKLIATAGSDLFHPAAFCFGEQRSGNVFAGAGHANARVLVETVVKSLARQAQDVGGVSGVFLLHSLEGGTGGGLAQQVLQCLKQEMPSSPLICVSPLPDPNLGHSVTAPYNLALAFEAVVRCARMVLLFDPRRLEEEAVRLWKMDIKNVETAPNRLIASCLNAFSAPLRFPAADALPLQLPDWLRMVSEEDASPAATVLLPEIRPLQAKLSGKQSIFTAEEVVKSCAAYCKGNRPDAPTVLLLRARLAEDIWGTRRVLGAVAMEKYRITAQRQPEGFENVTMLLPAEGIAERFQEFSRQAARLLQQRAYLHWYEALDISEARLAESVVCLQQMAEKFAGGKPGCFP